MKLFRGGLFTAAVAVVVLFFVILIALRLSNTEDPTDAHSADNAVEAETNAKTKGDSPPEDERGATDSLQVTPPELPSPVEDSSPEGGADSQLADTDPVSSERSSEILPYNGVENDAQSPLLEASPSDEGPASDSMDYAISEPGVEVSPSNADSTQITEESPGESSENADTKESGDGSENDLSGQLADAESDIEIQVDADVLCIQQRLAVFGFYDGPVDGIENPEIDSAANQVIRTFEHLASGSSTAELCQLVSQNSWDELVQLDERNGRLRAQNELSDVRYTGGAQAKINQLRRSLRNVAGRYYSQAYSSEYTKIESEMRNAIRLPRNVDVWKQFQVITNGFTNTFSIRPDETDRFVEFRSDCVQIGAIQACYQSGLCRRDFPNPNVNSCAGFTSRSEAESMCRDFSTLIELETEQGFTPMPGLSSDKRLWICELRLTDNESIRSVADYHYIYSSHIAGKYSRVGSPSAVTVGQNQPTSSISSGSGSPPTVTEPKSVVVPAEVIRKPIPEYPQKALRYGRAIEGSCEVEFSVSRFGRPYDISADCTDDIFEEPARDAVRAAKFKPKTVDGIPVESHKVVYPIEFSLAD